MIGPTNSNAIVELQLDTLLGEVAGSFGGGDALSWNGPLTFGADTAARRLIEERRKTDPSTALTVVLTTTGGVVEVVQRIVATIRHHYKVVNFVIPDYAYSAGTVLAMSGDAIFMDYFSRLGPIDPQIVRNDRLVPALGYCERYDDLIKKSADPNTPLTDAEISVLIGAFDQAELHEFEQARELSIELLKDWLARYKFKNWNKTETRKTKVTAARKKERAAEIARALSDTRRWHSHAAGISAKVLRDELNLKIDDLDDPTYLDRKQAVTNYQHLLEDYMAVRGTFGVIHMRGQYLAYHTH
jgi:Serine dehydrogenase proteinase